MTLKNTLLKIMLLIFIIAATLPSANAQANKWAYTRKITLFNKGEMVRNAVVMIYLNRNYYEKMAANGADIRFSSRPKLNGDGLSYWIEEWRGNNDITIIWIKIPLLIKQDNEIFMHYGNVDAKPVADGHDTFLFFDDFEDGDFSDKWQNVSIGQVEERDGMLKLKESDGELGQINAKYLLTGEVIVRAAYQREKGDQHWTQAGMGGWDRWFCFGDHTETDGARTNYLMLYPGESIHNLKTVPVVKSRIQDIDDKWHKLEFWFDGKQISGKQDVTTVAWVDNSISTYSSKLALRTLDNDSWDNFAYISVSPYIKPELLTITVGDEQKN